MIYEHGKGVDQDIAKAKTYYEMAAQEGDYDSKVQLLRINNPEIKDAGQWNNLGRDYYFARNGKEQDYVLARACYEQALKLNPKHISSLVLLCLIYEQGKGVDQDIAKAMSYCESAGLGKSYYFKILFLKKNNPEIKDADQWNNLGEDYYNGKEQDYVLARGCYDQALKLNIEHRDSNYRLATIYHSGQGVIVDYEKAREYYKKALDKGHTHAKKNLRKLEKEIVLDIKEKKGDIDAKDKNNDTALHRAAKYKQLKNCFSLYFARR